MSIYAGIDEAGYGPTLGPLVITGTACVCEKEDTDPSCLAELLCRETDIPLITDSKKIYSSQKGLRNLEKCVHAFLQLCFEKPPLTFSSMVKSLAGELFDSVFEFSPWFSGQDLTLPVSDIEISSLLKTRAEQEGISDVSVFSSVINVPLFNDFIRKGHNKGGLLFSEVCGILKKIISRFRDNEIFITVDKLGGRKFYSRFLRENFLDWNISLTGESKEESSYIMQHENTLVHISFRVKADADNFFVSVSSLISKYIRELSMVLFNQFFYAKDKSLKATQGYPEDAKRFLDDISSMVDTGTLEYLVRVR